MTASVGQLHKRAILMALLMASLLGHATEARDPSTGAKLAADFQARAKQYLDWRKKVAGNSPKPTDSPEVIATSQRELGNKVRVARAAAKQGEIFSPEIAQYFRHQIAASLRAKGGSKIRRSLLNDEPVNIDLQVNQSYPENIPLQSTPPSLLLKLPELPKGLEYRILGRQLVLRDTDANVVLDYVPNALP
jgi:hypothetical protein